MKDRLYEAGYKAGYKAGYNKAYRRLRPESGPTAIRIQACEACGAADDRDAAHARGCPALKPLSRKELIALARQVEDGWAAPEPERKPKRRSASAE